MRVRTYAPALFVFIEVALVACAADITSVMTATPTSSEIPGLIDCAETTSLPDGWSILPTFEPSYPCELENVSNRVDFCMVHASPELSYPCHQEESVQETVIGKGSRTWLIQREYRMAGGCWSGVSSEVRSLRTCDVDSGASDTIVEGLGASPLLSPDGDWFVFDALASKHDVRIHLFLVRTDGTDLTQLDTRPFPHQVVGARDFRWMEDSAWLEVSLWDGTGDGWHDYRIRTDGSGDYERLPAP